MLTQADQPIAKIRKIKLKIIAVFTEQSIWAPSFRFFLLRTVTIEICRGPLIPPIITKKNPGIMYA